MVLAREELGVESKRGQDQLKKWRSQRSLQCKVWLVDEFLSQANKQEDESH